MSKSIIIDLISDNEGDDNEDNDEKVVDEEDVKRDYIVYCLISADPKHANQTYVGITNNFARRIRQHNGEIKGGARRTRGYRPWKPLFHIVGFTKIQALQLEWTIKHKRRGYTGGPIGRFKTLEYVMGMNKWTQNSTPTKELYGIGIHFFCSETQHIKYINNKSQEEKTKSSLHDLPYISAIYYEDDE